MKQELRLIITQACNYDCYFCHHEGIHTIRRNLLNAEDIGYIFSIANENLGIETMTITGGEPLLSENIVDVVKKLYDFGCKTTIVTNGSLLNKRMDAIKYLSKINISLHSLEKDKYEKTVGKKNVFETVINNIITVRKEYPNIEINLNYALANNEELIKNISAMILFAKKYNVNVKFIELFPKESENYIPLEKLHNFLIENNHVLLEQSERKEKFYNSDSSFLYTTKCLCSRALDHSSPSAFCNKNNDLFISPDGKIELCRLHNDDIDLINEIKERKDKELVKKLVLSFNNLGRNCPYEK